MSMSSSNLIESFRQANKPLFKKYSEHIGFAEELISRDERLGTSEIVLIMGLLRKAHGHIIAGKTCAAMGGVRFNQRLGAERRMDDLLGRLKYQPHYFVIEGEKK